MMQYSHYPDYKEPDQDEYLSDDHDSEEEQDNDENDGNEETQSNDFQDTPGFIKSQGITEVLYKIIDPNKEFQRIQQKTKVKYKTKNDKKYIKAQDRIDLFQYYCSKCDNDFSSKSTKERHNCIQIEGDALNYAIKVANEHIKSGAITFICANANQTEEETEFKIEKRSFGARFKIEINKV